MLRKEFGFRGIPVEDPREAAKREVGFGWADLIDKIIDFLEASQYSFTIIQVKEKFGGLRFYIDLWQPMDYSREPKPESPQKREGLSMALAFIHEIEALSEKTCENCGNPGTSNTTFGWIKTLCEPCAGQREAQKAVRG